MPLPKDKRKYSNFFHVCYAEMCKRQNVPMLSIIKGTGSEAKAVLDICVDRIKLEEWGPIIGALKHDNSLHLICFRCRQHPKKIADHIDTESKLKQSNIRVPILTKYLLGALVESLTTLLSQTEYITCMELEGLPLSIEAVTNLTRGITKNNTLQHLSFQYCLIGDAGCEILGRSLRYVSNVASLNLTSCEVTTSGVTHLVELIKYQKISRYSESWKQTLRYREPDLDGMRGLRRITLNDNPKISDDGLVAILEILQDDLWMKALDFQNCNITEMGAQKVLETLGINGVIDIIDLRRNSEVSQKSLQQIMMTLCKNSEMGDEGKFQWLATSRASLPSNTSSASRVSSATAISTMSRKPPSQGDTISLRRSNTTLQSGRRSDISNASSKPHEVWSAIKIPSIVETKQSVAEQLKDAKNEIRKLHQQLEQEVDERKKVDNLNLQLHSQLMEVMNRPGGLGDGRDNREGFVYVEKDVLQDIYKAFHEFFAIFPAVKSNGVNKIKGDILCNKLQSIIEESPRSLQNEDSDRSSSRAIRKTKTTVIHHVTDSGDKPSEARNEPASLTPRAQQLFNTLLSMEEDDYSEPFDEEIEEDDIEEDYGSDSNRSPIQSVKFINKLK